MVALAILMLTLSGSLNSAWAQRLAPGRLILRFLPAPSQDSRGIEPVFEAALTQPGIATLAILDVQGSRLLRLLTWTVTGTQARFNWDGKDQVGNTVMIGRYLALFRLATGSDFEEATVWFAWNGAVPPAALTATSKGVIIQSAEASPSSLASGSGETMLNYVLSQDAQLEVLVMSSGSTGVVWRQAIGSAGSTGCTTGKHALKIRGVDQRLQPLAPGRYRVVLMAQAGRIRDVRNLELGVVLTAVDRPSTLAGPSITSVGPSPDVAQQPSGAGAASGSGNSSAAGTLSGASPTTDGHGNNGVRDHGVGEGRDGAGQGQGNGKGPGR